MTEYPLLENINTPEDVRNLEAARLPQLCNEVREYLVDTLSNVGGHFASNLGVTELTVALHYAFNTPEDKLVWDVGHQIYPHKILTGRKERLKSVRRLGGLSGFPQRQESEYDTYNTGHAGTSISQVVGEAAARDALGKKHHCVAVIGDASIGAGMCFEALNHGGEIQTNCVVILNDNDMSISHNVGALNQYLNRLITSPLYNKSRRMWLRFLLWLPVIGPALQTFAKRAEKSFKDLVTPGSLFSDFGFRYVGPVDGHNVKELVRVLEKVKKMKGPILIHCYTQKGKGYRPAEDNPIKYHAVSTFNKGDGSPKTAAKTSQITYSQIVGETLRDMVEADDKVVAVTPAMIEGSGLRPLYNKYPEKVYDVGIAEQHCLSFVGGLASGGLKPYLCIYSTFLNRGFGQLIQDVALMNFPVRMVVDRAGCVGPDGETHQGLYDLGILLSVPNIRVHAPASGLELKAMLLAMKDDEEGPIAVRFPKAALESSEMEKDLPDVTSTRPVLHASGKQLAILAVGAMWETGLEVEKQLRNDAGILSTVVGIRWIRPMDFEYMNELLKEYAHFIIIEDSYIYSSAAAYIQQNLKPEINAKHIQTYAFPEEAIPHGTRDEIFDMYGLSPAKISSHVIKSGQLEGNTLAQPMES